MRSGTVVPPPQGSGEVHTVQNTPEREEEDQMEIDAPAQGSGASEATRFQSDAQRQDQPMGQEEVEASEDNTSAE